MIMTVSSSFRENTVEVRGLWTCALGSTDVPPQKSDATPSDSVYIQAPWCVAVGSYSFKNMLPLKFRIRSRAYAGWPKKLAHNLYVLTFNIISLSESGQNL